MRRLEKYSRVEGDVLKAGEDIQSLARFVGAQRTAFAKLLKKYKKWTSSSTLGVRFQNEVLGRPKSFSQTDFSQLLAQWTDVLAAVRAPFEAGLSWKLNAGDSRDTESVAGGTKTRPDGSGLETSHDYRKDSNVNETELTSAAQLYAINKTGSDVDVDTALATIPLGRTAGKAAYWVHPDNIVQLYVLLLQHTRLRRRNADAPSPTSPASVSSSRRGSVRGSIDGRIADMEDEAGTIVCDDLNSFARRRNNATVSEIETLPGNVVEGAATSIRYSSTGEAIVAVGTPSNTSEISSFRTITSMKKAKLKRKALSQLFDQDSPTASKTRANSGLKESRSFDQDFFTVRQWLHEHHDIRPLVHLRCRRSRFVGLGNNKAHGTWAVLDQDVSMKRSSFDDLNEFTTSHTTTNEATPDLFPFAVLEVRWEGESRPDLVQALDGCHLVSATLISKTRHLTHGADRESARVFVGDTRRSHTLQALGHARSVLGKLFSPSNPAGVH